MMNITILERELVKHAIPKSMYELSNTLPNEKYCIGKNGDAWEVYYSERGRKTQKTDFQDESSACEFFLDTIKKINENGN